MDVIFFSEEFKEFLQKNGIKHTTSAPYHPSTNGFAVQMFKQGLTKLKEGTINEHISRFLFNYRITLQSTTGTSAELLLGRRQRFPLNLFWCQHVDHIRRRLDVVPEIE